LIGGEDSSSSFSRVESLVVATERREEDGIARNNRKKELLTIFSVCLGCDKKDYGRTREVRGYECCCCELVLGWNKYGFGWEVLWTS
jgi:hypothetical protein